jgi:hypothetical protein
MERKQAPVDDSETRSDDSWMDESQPTVKLRCAAKANETTHAVTHTIAKQVKLCPTYRRHLQRLVRRHNFDMARKMI